MRTSYIVIVHDKLISHLKSFTKMMLKNSGRKITYYQKLIFSYN